MGVVVRGIDAPLVPGMRVRGVLDAVGDRVLFAILHCKLHTKSGLCTCVCACMNVYVHVCVHDTVCVCVCVIMKQTNHLAFFKLAILHILKPKHTHKKFAYKPQSH